MGKNARRDVDFFISRTGADSAIAQSIAGILKEGDRRGRYTVVVQDWDFGSANFVEKMDDALGRAHRLIIVLSNAYLSSKYCALEWQRILVDDPHNFDQRAIIFRVDQNCLPSGILGLYAFTDLSLLTEDEAALHEAVLSRADPSRSQRIHDSRVVTSFVTLKIFAWGDRGHETSKDAQDLATLLRSYPDAGNEQRLYGEAIDAMEAVEYRIDLAGARLLGRDTRRMLTKDTRKRLTSS